MGHLAQGDEVVEGGQRVPVAGHVGGGALLFCRARGLSALRKGTDQVPFVAGDVEEHGDAAIGFPAR